MPGYGQEFHQQPRSRAIEKVFQDNRDEILADLESLELSLRDIANKFKVNDRNVRRWAERLNIDSTARTVARRNAGYGTKRCLPRKSKQKDEVSNPALLSMRW